MPPLPPRGDALALARALVAVDSRNPALAPDGPGEAACAHLLADTLTAWGLAVELHDSGGGRPNVVARGGPEGGPSLLLNGHLDVVATDNMVHPPFDPVVRDGRLYGRGSTDMKGGVAAMCAATIRALDAGTVRGPVIVAAVTDEEWRSAGTRALVARGIRADAAIVTEPTRLAVAPAHKGFCWADVTVHGVAAHGSRWDVGVDAITHAGLLLAELDRWQREVLTTRSHPMLGRPSLHASFVQGGLGMSTYADMCVLSFERRTIPGERPEDFVPELQAACARVAAQAPGFRAEVTFRFAQDANDVPVDHALVRTLRGALGDTGLPDSVEGLWCWTDCAILSEAGIPAVCFGPGDIARAHAAEEWVAVEELEQATAVLARAIARWGAGEH